MHHVSVRKRNHTEMERNGILSFIGAVPETLTNKLYIRFP